MRFVRTINIITILIFVLSCLLGCKKVSPGLDNENIKITSYNNFHEVELELNAQVLIKNSGNFLEFIYAQPDNSDSLTLHVINRNLEEDSVLFYYDDTTRLIQSQTYIVEGRPWEIRKYFSDAGGIADGEYLIYWTDELGILSIQNQAWGNFQMFYYEDEKISQVLKADTLGLFTRFGDRTLIK